MHIGDDDSHMDQEVPGVINFSDGSEDSQPCPANANSSSNNDTPKIKRFRPRSSRGTADEISSGYAFLDPYLKASKQKALDAKVGSCPFLE